MKKNWIDKLLKICGWILLGLIVVIIAIIINVVVNNPIFVE